MRAEKLSIILVVFAVCAGAFAEIKMPSIFSDGMVLQAQKGASVWGTARAGAKVDVVFGGAEKSAQAGADGKWRVELGSLEKSSEPRKLKVFEDGKLAKTVADVLVGEVWVCAGQSNMAYTFGWMPKSYSAKFYAEADNVKNIREFFTPPRGIAETPQWDFPKGSRWIKAQKGNLDEISCVGYFFAREISQHLDTPVAIIYVPTGGSNMMCWISEENVTNVAVWKQRWQAFLNAKAKYTDEVFAKQLAAYEGILAAHKEEVEKAKKAGKPAPKFETWRYPQPVRITPWRVGKTPTYLWNGRIAPLAGFGARGILWYQGESDTAFDGEGKFDSSAHFAEQFGALISQWRRAWGEADMPFISVQLASYDQKYGRWADVRLRQREVAAAMCGGMIATAIDLGEEKDIHPRYKDVLGGRLADIALCDVYGQSAKGCRSAVFYSFNFDGDKVFAACKSGSPLVVRGELRGVEVLVGVKWVAPKSLSFADNVLVARADGRVDGVRYLHKNWAQPDICIFSRDGLPAFPFMNLRAAK